MAWIDLLTFSSNRPNLKRSSENEISDKDGIHSVIVVNVDYSEDISFKF